MRHHHHLLLLLLLALPFGARPAASGPAGAPVDSRHEGEARIADALRTDVAAIQRAKRAELEALTRARTVSPDSRGISRVAPTPARPPAMRPKPFGTARPPDAAERAAREAQSLAKHAGGARRMPTAPSAPPAATARKPAPSGTSLPLTPEALARSLALERAKRVTTSRSGPAPDRP